MRCSPLLCLLLIAISSAVHAAATSPPGVNLRWDNCYGDGGVQYKNFACDTNAGTERLVGSFELSSDMPGVTGLEMYLHLGSASATLPAWWQVRNAGTCRVAALSAQVLPAGGPSACTDWSAGTASGGIAAYTLNTQGTNHARIVMGSAAPPGGVDLAAGQEYFAFQLTLSHIKTVGTGACAGCLEPACVFLSAIDVIPGTNPSVLLSQGANYSGSRWVSWQMGYPINIQQGCSATGGGLFCLNPTTYFDVVPYSPTSTRGSTWGAVKALYR